MQNQELIQGGWESSILSKSVQLWLNSLDLLIHETLSLLSQMAHSLFPFSFLPVFQTGEEREGQQDRSGDCEKRRWEVFQAKLNWIWQDQVLLTLSYSAIYLFWHGFNQEQNMSVSNKKKGKIIFIFHSGLIEFFYAR